LLNRKKASTVDISSSVEALELPFSEKEEEDWGQPYSGSAFYS